MFTTSPSHSVGLVCADLRGEGGALWFGSESVSGAAFLGPRPGCEHRGAPLPGLAVTRQDRTECLKSREEELAVGTTWLCSVARRGWEAVFPNVVAQVGPGGTQENVPEQAIFGLVTEGSMTGPCVPAGWAGRCRCPGQGSRGLWAQVRGLGVWPAVGCCVV